MTGFLQFEEPGIVDVLVLISFITFLPLSTWLAAKTLRAGLLGPLLLGIIYGKPLGDILQRNWQETFLALGYIGLIVIIFDGGLNASLGLLKQHLVLATLAATIGIVTPIAFSYLVLYLGFGYSAIETFIIGASLASTSLGTTFAVMSSAPTTQPLTQTHVGSVLTGAAVIDDVVTLVMASVIESLGTPTSTPLAWVIGRPIVAAVALTALTPPLTRYILGPLHRRFLTPHLTPARALFLLLVILSAFLAIASYAGTSPLLGAFVAGLLLASLTRSAPHPDGSVQPTAATYQAAYAAHVAHAQEHVLAPLFFASIGSAVPFLALWHPPFLWRGVVFALLMALGKMAVGLALPLWGLLSRIWRPRGEAVPAHGGGAREAALLLALAMVPRGEIGLLILELGVGSTPYVKSEGFVVGVWANLLCTILGPIGVGLVVKLRGEAVVNGVWGVPSVELDS